MTVVRIVLTLCFRQFLYCEFELDNFNKICQICPNCKHRNINNRFPKSQATVCSWCGSDRNVWPTEYYGRSLSAKM